MEAKSEGDRIQIEHEILAHVGQALQTALDVQIEPSTVEQWLERFRFLADSFGRHLRRLFAIEEEGGFLQPAVVLQPTLGDRANRLLQDHQVLMATLVAILVDARSSSPKHLPNLQQLRQRLIGFFERLEAHQQSEWELCTEAFLVDIGGEG